MPAPHKRTISAAGLLLALAANAAMASELTMNGFLSAVGGKALETEDNPNAFPCNCAVVDYPFVGTYDEDWTFDAETTFGLQTNFKVNDKLSVTGQMVAHGSQDYKTDIEWAYISYNLNDSWTAQIGKKRLPLFYYSDFFDVGYAVPWMRAPGDLYGWQIVGYEGINALYNSSWGDWGVIGNVWYGRDQDNNNALLSDVYYGVRVDETWKDMLGGYLDLSRDWLTLRVVYMTNKVDRLIYDESPPRVRLEDEKQKFWGIAANIDYGDLVVRSEYNTFERPGEENKYKAALFGIGYRFGDFLPMITSSSFEETATWPDIEKHNTRSFSLRWDFASSAAFKIQYDIFEDESRYFYYPDENDPVSDFIGDSKLLTLGVDVVF
ncbi:porin [Permianibacter sp. IMCC34836]|uniref:porin n=1 Tax=Permianibacter fluminis TaxID=2738515 RepID=UPI00155623EE|nr:porin [Permianibacter fluminis]NQD38113.1 porin [Permianibacter fluminis]